jgi:hypothetical protein
MEVGTTEVVKKGKKTAATKPVAVAKKATVPSNTIVEPIANTVIDPSTKTITVATSVKLQRKQTVVSTKA